MPISDWISDEFSSDLAAGIGHVVVNVHYLADALEAHLAAQKRPFSIAISDERSQLLETGGGMVRALPLLTGDPILIVNSDNIWTDGPEDSIRHLARHWDGERMDALLLLIRQARDRKSTRLTSSH